MIGQIPGGGTICVLGFEAATCQSRLTSLLNKQKAIFIIGATEQLIRHQYINEKRRGRLKASFLKARSLVPDVCI
jgi:hypothetical protein